MTQPLISVVITAYNEGSEVARTIDSVRANTSSPLEVLLVDDGSTDACCEIPTPDDQVRVITRSARFGIASSRVEACRIARGQVLAFCDAHQRIEQGCLEKCSSLAISQKAIVTPDIADFDKKIRLHGAYSVICGERHYLTAEWKYRLPRGGLGRVSALRAPTYLIPRSVYDSVKWSSLLRGWGGSEASVSLKAFFTGTPILHLCGPLVLHKFKQTFHYDVQWPEVWRNQAITTRVCFDDRSWYKYWLPEVFEAHLTEDVRRELESDAIREEQDAFSKLKVRRDEEFWSSLVFQSLPPQLQ